MIGRPSSEERKFALEKLDDIIRWRKEGIAIHDIADKVGVKYAVINYILHENGYSGYYRAKPQHRVYGMAYMPILQRIIGAIEDDAEELLVEKSADNEGWIAYIDDVPGNQEPDINTAIRAAYLKWEEARHREVTE